jgi:hypothetical protein
MILTISHRKQSGQEIEEHACTNTCTKEYYSLPKTLETKNKGVVDMDGVNVE